MVEVIQNFHIATTPEKKKKKVLVIQLIPSVDKEKAVVLDYNPVPCSYQHSMQQGVHDGRCSAVNVDVFIGIAFISFFIFLQHTPFIAWPAQHNILETHVDVKRTGRIGCLAVCCVVILNVIE